MFQFSCRFANFAFDQLFVFQIGHTENNVNFDAVSSKRGNFDDAQQRRQIFDQKSARM